MDEWVRDFAEHGHLTPYTMEHIGWLLADPDENELNEIKWIVGYMRLVKSASLPEKSRQLCDQYTQIADAAEALASLIEGDQRHSLSDVRGLLVLASDYRERANDADPKGKRQRANAAHYKLADLLVDRIGEGTLSVRLRVNNDSDLAQLFSLCCSEIGINPPENVIPYLTEAREKLKIEQRQRKIRLKIQGLMQKIVRANLGKDDSDQSKNWQALAELKQELKDLQKDQ